MNESQMMVMELGGKGYSCAQIVLLGGLRLMARENPDLVRSMAGLAQGVGCSGEICGALAGGVCLLALHTGKGADNELPLENGAVMMNELVEWFRDNEGNGGAITCDAVLGWSASSKNTSGRLSGRAMEPVRCGGMVARVWEKAVTLLTENGLDPGLGREEN